MIAYLSLGSNVGDRRANLTGAVQGLRSEGVDVLASSSVYDTEPVGLVLDQPEFLNAVLSVAVPDGLGPERLLDLVKGLELRLGRVPGGVRHGPRVIDIDVLLMGDLVFSSDRLDVPHIGLVERRFVLVPLLEIAPELTLPMTDGTGPALADILGGLDGGPGQDVRVAGPPLI